MGLKKNASKSGWTSFRFKTKWGEKWEHQFSRNSENPESGAVPQWRGWKGNIRRKKKKKRYEWTEREDEEDLLKIEKIWIEQSR